MRSGVDDDDDMLDAFTFLSRLSCFPLPFLLGLLGLGVGMAPVSMNAMNMLKSTSNSLSLRGVFIMFSRPHLVRISDKKLGLSIFRVLQREDAGVK